jgi:hypothetical protein
LAQTSAQGLGTLSLAFGFAIEGGAGQFHAGEVFEHGAGLLDGQLAGQERGHVLHGRGLAGGFFLAQGRVGGRAPFAATFAVGAGALDRDRTAICAKKTVT